MADDKKPEKGVEDKAQDAEVNLEESDKIKDSWEDHLKETDPVRHKEEYKDEDSEEVTDEDSDDDSTGEDEDDSTDEKPDGKPADGSTADEEDEDSEKDGSDDDEDLEDGETPPEDDTSEDEEAVSEIVIDYTAAKKKSKFALRLDKDGQLTSRSKAELTNKLAETGRNQLLKESQEENVRLSKEFNGEKIQLTRQLDEVVRAANRQKTLDEPISHLIEMVRREPIVRQAIENWNDQKVQGLLMKHGFDPQKQSVNYDYSQRESELGVLEDNEIRFKESVGVITDKVLDDYQKANSLSDEDIVELLKYGKENFDFNARVDEKGYVQPPEKQGEWFKFQLENAHGRALKFGVMKTTEHSKSSKELDKEKNKSAREKARQKKRNRRFKAAPGSQSPASTAGKTSTPELQEGESMDEYLARNPKIQKAAKDAGITLRG